MKKYILLLPLLMAVFFAKAQTIKTYTEQTTFTSAIDYNDYVVGLIDVIDNIWDAAIDEQTLKQSLAYSNDLKTQTTNILKSLKKIKGYNENTGFQNAVNNYAKHMNKIANKELPNFIKLIRDGKPTVEKDKKADALIPMLDGERERLFTLIETEQAAFANQNNFTIEHN